MIGPGSTILTAVTRLEMLSLSVVFFLKSLSSFFQETKSESFVGKEGDNGFLAFSNHEDVPNSSGEGVAIGILNMGNVETSRVLLNVLENTNSADVVTTSGQN